VATRIEHTLNNDRIVEASVMLAEATLFVEDGSRRENNGAEIIGESPALKEVLRQVEIVAPTDAAVLL
jgi:formate hydrogenlyase transcriptional activator